MEVWRHVGADEASALAAGVLDALDIAGVVVAMSLRETRNGCQRVRVGTGRYPVWSVGVRGGEISNTEK